MAPMKLLVVDPKDTLTFVRPPQASSTASRVLKITNSSNGYVAYKVKTTAPKAYLVRPSLGTLRAGESQDVQIILQASAMDESTSSHRFLVQAVSVEQDTVTRDEWSTFPSASIQEMRLNVLLEDQDTDGSRQIADTSGNAARAGGGGSGETSDLKVKYDELVLYTLTLEKEKKKLQKELEDVQRQRTGGDSGAGGGISKATLIFAVVVAFVAAYATKFVD